MNCEYKLCHTQHYGLNGYILNVEVSEFQKFLCVEKTNKHHLYYGKSFLCVFFSYDFFFIGLGSSSCSLLNFHFSSPFLLTSVFSPYTYYTLHSFGWSFFFHSYSCCWVCVFSSFVLNTKFYYVFHNRKCCLRFS